MRKVICAILSVILCLFTSCSSLGEISSSESEPQSSELGGNSYVSENNDPVSIETEGGAVLTGEIKRNNENLIILELSDTLNLTLNYTVPPENFNDVSIMFLYDSFTDGVDKEAYIGKTVTIKGIIQNYRGSGMLYLYVVLIEEGQGAQPPYADETITLPMKVYGVNYDPDKPLPDEIKPKTDENGNYVFNPYSLSIDALSYLGNDFAFFYVDFVNAFLNYETSCPCPSKDYADFLMVFLFSEFPIFQCDGDYTYSTAFNAENNTLNWSYLSVDKLEHQRLIDEFSESVNEYVSQVSEDMSELKKASLLYRSFCRSVDYNYDALETRIEVEPYYGFINKSGICVTFAGDYMYLLTNVGIESYYVSGEVGESHAWNLVTIDGENYFCDPTFDAGIMRDENSFSYFGKTTADRIEDGMLSESVSIGSFWGRSLEDVQISEVPIEIDLY